MRTLKLLFISLLVLAIVMPTTVMAKDTDKAGKITATAGKAEVKKGGGSKKFNAFKGMALTQGDTILTGSDGKVTLDLDSDKQVTIGSGTTLVISELVKSAKALGGKTSLSLLKGKVLITIKKKLEGDSRFEIETPTAIMGVMGTQFTVQYEEGESYVGVFEGSVKTKHGEQLEEETIVNPNEQLGLDVNGGDKEKLNYRDLPLVGLEHYLALLEKDAKADKALIEQVKQLIAVKKQEEAAAALKDNGSTSSDTKIVYEDGSGQIGGGGGVVVPTQAPTAAPTPTATPVPTATPTATPVATETPAPTEEPVPPLLDLDALYRGVQSYIFSDKTFYLPFTASVAYNGPNSSFPEDGSKIVKLEVFNDEMERFEERAIVDKVTVSSDSSKQLLVQLSEPIEYGSKIRFTILAGQLKNAETNDIQGEDLVTSNIESGQDIEFIFKQELYDREYKHEDASDDGVGVVAVELYSLGYQIPYDSEVGADIRINKVCPETGEYPSPGRYYEEGCGSEFEYDLKQYVLNTSMVGPNRMAIALHITNFQLLEPALYEVIINLQDDRGQPHYVRQAINIVAKKPPVPIGDMAYTPDSSTLILPFTSNIASADGMPINPSDVSVIVMPDLPGFLPALIEGSEGPIENSAIELDIESVFVDPNEAKQLIVKFVNEMEYGTVLLVTIAADSLMNAETLDVQKEFRSVLITHKAALLTREVEFVHEDPNQLDKEVLINTYGFEIGQPVLNRLSEEGEFEPPYELDGVYAISGEGDIKTLKLLAEYFNASYVEPGWYELAIPIMDSEWGQTWLNLSIHVKIPLV
ncbi:FecR domain-containing protein [Paenibacillus sp. 2TAB23]|uniref:FecR family protein n=1 Tax=Paenibacillus sp. 2TAB23 TaxID=3233004 RepID=UPI003F944140